MTNETMTVHKALAELKIIDDRIQKAIANGVFCVANKHSNEKINGVPVDDFKKTMQGSFDKASDLITRRNAIKRAVVNSNATTQVKVGEMDYTVAEAIEMKNHGVELKEMLLHELETQYKKAQAVILYKNSDDLEKRAEQYVVGIYGTKEGKTNTDDFEKTKKDFIASNTYELVDPILILKKIESLESEISEFKAEVDAALSTSNAITQIEISY
jgi:hypothetical protein